MKDVALISMPFGNVLVPSIGLGLLKGGLTRDAVPTIVHYFTIPFAELTGLRFYMDIANDAKPSVRELPGEWIFSAAVFDTTPEDDERFMQEILQQKSGWNTRYDSRRCPPGLARQIRGARDLVPGFLECCVEQVLQNRPRVVGFTSTFQQQLASLALARRIKAAAPDTIIVFGGANNDDVMGAEVVRQFPFVDAAVCGEGDLVFPELVRRVLTGQPYGDLPGVRTRATVRLEFLTRNFSQATPVHAMDDLPYPDYSDFFEQFTASRFEREWQARVLYESSRGCWWGVKKHCTFCGLNGKTMTYRSKSPRRAVDELVHLSEQHPGCDIQVVDNILDMGYFKTVLPELASRNLGLELFYETKSNLRKDQVRLMRDAGITDIQPGIETFSDSILALMRKGVTGLQNIQLLKWCRELGVHPTWNVLWGFPGEDPGEYARMATLVPWLTHLTPPVGIAGIRLDRFSPNFFDADGLGFSNVQPLPAYAHVYRLPPEAVANLAYHFTFEYKDGRDVDGYIRPMLRELKRWKRASGQSALVIVDAGDRAVIWDTRPASRQAITVLEGVERAWYAACDHVTDLHQLSKMAAQMGAEATAADVQHRLAPLVELGLLLSEGARYLALAVPLGEYSPSAAIVRQIYALAKSFGRPSPAGAVVPIAPLNGGGVRAPVAVAPSEPRRGFPRRRSRRLTASQFGVTADELLVRFTST